MKKILILTANPKNTDKLRLDEEVREIQAGLKRAQKRDQFEILTQWAWSWDWTMSMKFFLIEKLLRDFLAYCERGTSRAITRSICQTANECGAVVASGSYRRRAVWRTFAPSLWGKDSEAATECHITSESYTLQRFPKKFRDLSKTSRKTALNG